MRWISLFCLLLLFACSQEQNDSSDSHLEADTLTQNQELVVTSDSIESKHQDSETHLISEKGKAVFYANVGIYGSPAILVLDIPTEIEKNNQDGTVQVEGYYFYVSRQKNLQLKGELNSSEQVFRLTESHQGKTTGYFNFSLKDPSINYWTTAEEQEDHQELMVREIIPKNDKEEHLNFSMEKLTHKHEVLDMSAQTESWESVEDDLSLVFINDDFLAFDLNVVRTNFHTGGAFGLAEKSDDSTYVWLGEEGCELTFILTDHSVETFDNGCDYYHGFRASLDANFNR